MSARRYLIGVLILAGLFSATAQSIIGQQTQRSAEQAAGRQPLVRTAPLESEAEHDRRMKWFREARFGMFIHWGLRSPISCRGV